MAQIKETSSVTWSNCPPLFLITDFAPFVVAAQFRVTDSVKMLSLSLGQPLLFQKCCVSWVFPSEEAAVNVSFCRAERFPGAESAPGLLWGAESGRLAGQLPLTMSAENVLIPEGAETCPVSRLHFWLFSMCLCSRCWALSGGRICWLIP